jgi:ABC-type phosphate transport system substrate-binding protein
MPTLMRKLWMIGLLCGVSSLAQAESSSPVIAVIVNNEELKIVSKELTTSELSLIYWRKQLYWPKGQRIKPVNLRSEHPLRQQFSQAVLGSLPKKQIDYWNGQYFNGILPPYSVNSEEAVLRYVAQTSGAIGYVDACHIDGRVKAVLWIEQDQISAVPPENLHCP